MVRAAVVGVVCLLAAGLVAVPGRASLYQPDDPQFSLKVGPDGKPQELDFETEFRLRRAQLTNMLDPTPRKNEDRARLLERIKTRQKTQSRTPEQKVALAVDLLRSGQREEAEGLLARDRSGFLPNVTLAHVYAAKGDWAKAIEYLQIANEPDPRSPLPASLPGLTKEQLAWQLELNKTYLARYFDVRYEESRAKPRPSPESETYIPLFPLPQPGKPADPVRFVNDAGAYEPGVLSAAERAKLPPDAVAVVQQLLLWVPGDARLYWLLGELYAAEGKLGPAQTIMDQCVSSAGELGNRKLLVDHRAAVRAAAAAKPAAPTDVPLAAQPDPGEQQPQGDPNAVPISMKTVWIYFGAVAAVAALALLRVLTRRGKAGCGPVG